MQHKRMPGAGDHRADVFTGQKTPHVRDRSKVSARRFTSDWPLAAGRSRLVLGIVLVLFGHVAQAQGPLLLPSHVSDSPADSGPGRVPPVQRPAPATPPGDSPPPAWSPDLVEFAAGALIARRPLRWWVEDTPRGNYVFLLLAPQKPPRRLGSLPLGLWATFVPRGPGQVPRRMTLERLSHVVRTLSGNRFPLPQARPTRWQDHPGLLVRARRSGQNAPLVMAALGITTPWGEYYAGYIAPEQQAAPMQALWQQWLARCQLRPPQRPRRPAPVPGMKAAEALLGWWKTPRGQLYLGPEGLVVLQFDRRGSFEPGPDGTLRYDRPLVELRGRATSRDDLLLVTWSDGSRTNYRWRLHQGDLLLTDHLGRTSRLKPLARWNR